jgi:uncharacterized membrane protein YeaQ/YmgE (transglycosylase-associated protein family)
MISASPNWLEILAHPFKFYVLSTFHIAVLAVLGISVGFAYALGLGRVFKLSPQIGWVAYVVIGLVGSFGADVMLSFLVYYFYWPPWIYSNRLLLLIEDILCAFLLPLILFKPFS